METGSFSTHLNYIRCIRLLFSNAELVFIKGSNVQKSNGNVKRFQQLAQITHRSIDFDWQLAQSNYAFAQITAPWFAVKCYYSLYYRESILAYLFDGTSTGFTKGGHAKIRSKFRNLVKLGQITISNQELNSVHQLSTIRTFPLIASGSNTRSNFWMNPECSKSLAKKLMDYALHDQKMVHNWNLRTKKDRASKEEYIQKSELSLLDFFFWYRIKANYRDLDYIDFEKGVSEFEVFQYMRAYCSAYWHYCRLLDKAIQKILS